MLNFDVFMKMYKSGMCTKTCRLMRDCDSIKEWPKPGYLMCTAPADSVTYFEKYTDDKGISLWDSYGKKFARMHNSLDPMDYYEIEDATLGESLVSVYKPVLTLEPLVHTVEKIIDAEAPTSKMRNYFCHHACEKGNIPDIIVPHDYDYSSQVCITYNSDILTVVVSYVYADTSKDMYIISWSTDSRDLPGRPIVPKQCSNLDTQDIQNYITDF